MIEKNSPVSLILPIFTDIIRQMRLDVETFQMFKGTVCVMDEGEKKPF